MDGVDTWSSVLKESSVSTLTVIYESCVRLRFIPEYFTLTERRNGRLTNDDVKVHGTLQNPFPLFIYIQHFKCLF